MKTAQQLWPMNPNFNVYVLHGIDVIDVWFEEDKQLATHQFIESNVQC